MLYFATSLSLVISLVVSVVATAAPNLGQSTQARRPVQATPTPVPSTFQQAFAKPPIAARIKARWWWPAAAVNEKELGTELHEMKMAGFSGAEISILPPSEGVDLGTYGWSSQQQNKAFLSALHAAASEGMKLDFTLGASWPISSPQIKDLDDPRAEKELVYGFLKTDAPLSGDAPPPIDGVTEHAKLVAITAARIIDPASTQKPVLLDLASMQALPLPTSGQSFTFTPPSAGTWAVFGFWSRSTGQTTLRPVDSTTSYVIDHFSKFGTNALIEDWKARFNTPEMKEALKLAGGDLFGDSLEISAYQLWSPDVFNNFSLRRGYALTKYLPLLHIENIHNPYAAFLGGVRSPDAPPDFDVAVEIGKPNQDIGKRVRYDYYQTLNELMEANHLTPLRNLAQSYGLKLRYQPAYGTTLNLISNSRLVDVPETESLHSGNQIDYHRAMASAAHLMGKQVVSSECCALISADYGQNLKDMLNQINVNFAGGVNQIVFHGTPYRFEDKSVQWPGWAPFAPQAPIDFSEAWDSRQPFWSQIRDFTHYLARTQFALRQGEARIDIAIYHESNWWPAAKFFFETQAPAIFTETSLAKMGYTYDFIDPSLLTLLPMKRGGAHVSLGRPEYKAIILDHQTDMTVDSASKIANLARMSVPVIIIGDDPSRSPSNKPQDDLRVRTLFTQLRTSRSVIRLANSSDLISALAKIDVQPAMNAKKSMPLLSVRRESKTEEIYFLYNSSTTDSVSEDIWLQTRRKNPAVAELDPWNGDSHTVDYLFEKQAVRTHVDLAPGQTTLILLSDDLLQIGPLRQSFGPKAQSVNLANWTLDVKEFAPSPKTPIHLTLSDLKDWTQIPQLKDVSGIGVYHTTFNRPATAGAVILAIPTTDDSVRVRVNGKSVGAVDPTSMRLDITAALNNGANSIDIEVATTLRNRLITLWQAGWAEQMAGLYKQMGAPLPNPAPYSSQRYGLSGQAQLLWN